jgi:hypothetical protein
MFYMPGTKMLFGDAKDSCEGALTWLFTSSRMQWADAYLSVIAIKRGLDARG